MQSNVCFATDEARMAICLNQKFQSLACIARQLRLDVLFAAQVRVPMPEDCQRCV
jgi:hypothetical protein